MSGSNNNASQSAIIRGPDWQSDSMIIRTSIKLEAPQKSSGGFLGLGKQFNDIVEGIKKGVDAEAEKSTKEKRDKDQLERYYKSQSAAMDYLDEMMEEEQQQDDSNNRSLPSMSHTGAFSFLNKNRK